MRLASSHFDPRAAFVSLAAHGLALGAIAAVSAGIGPALQSVDPPQAAYMVVLAPYAPVPAAPVEAAPVPATPVETPVLTAAELELVQPAPPAQPELPQPSKPVAQAAAAKVPAPKARPARPAESRTASQVSTDAVSAYQPMQEARDASVAGARSDASDAEISNTASQRDAALASNVRASDAAPASDLPAATQTVAAEPLVRAARFRVPPSPPRYPRRAIELDLRGTTILRALVDVDGAATEIVVWTSSGVRLLDDAAIAAARGWKFEPAFEGTVAVAAWVEVPVRFELK